MTTNEKGVQALADDHAELIADQARSAIVRKYSIGQREHGGLLYLKPQARNILDEALDQVTYALTLQDQHQKLLRLAESGTESELREAVRRYCA